MSWAGPHPQGVGRAWSNAWLQRQRERAEPRKRPKAGAQTLTTDAEIYRAVDAGWHAFFTKRNLPLPQVPGHYLIGAGFAEVPPSSRARR